MPIVIPTDTTGREVETVVEPPPELRQSDLWPRIEKYAIEVAIAYTKATLHHLLAIVESDSATEGDETSR